MKGIITLLAVTICTLTFSKNPVSNPDPPPPTNDRQLFGTDIIWDIHLKFTEEDWEAIQPEWKGGFGPGGILAPAFLAVGDKDGDRQLSQEEFIALAEVCFDQWAGSETAELTKDQIRKGIGEFANKPNDGNLLISGLDGERNGVASVLGVEFPDSNSDVDFQGMELENVAVRYKGNGTFMDARESKKFSFKLDINDDYPGRTLAGVTKVNLHNCVTDASYMNEVLAYRLFRDAGVIAPRTAYARLDVTSPETDGSKYTGLYTLVENVDKQFLKDHFGTKKGAIFKPVTPNLFSYLGDDWSAYNQIYDPKTDLSEDEILRVIELCKLVSQPDDIEFEGRISEFIDLDNLARFLAVSVLISDLDGILGPGQNFYLYLDQSTEKFTFIPWDQDHSFGQMKRTQEHREKLSIRRPWNQGNSFLERLFNMESFYALYRVYLDSFSKHLFTPERLSAQVDELSVILEESIRMESEEHYDNFRKLVEWDPSKDTVLSPEARATHDHGNFGTSADVKPIKGFVVKRHESVRAQLAGVSEGIEDTFPVNIGKFFARLDFSDLFLNTMDLNNDELLSREELVKGFDTVFEKWNRENKDHMTAMEMKVWMNSALSEAREE